MTDKTLQALHDAVIEAIDESCIPCFEQHDSHGDTVFTCCRKTSGCLVKSWKQVLIDAEREHPELINNSKWEDVRNHGSHRN